jgi:ABC-type nitrate/sulfonate/bicarbonate transport system permease component
MTAGDVPGPRPSRQVVLGIAGLVITGGLLEILPRLPGAPAGVPPVSEWLVALAGLLATGEVWVAIGRTVASWSLGLALAVVAGSAAGLLIGSSRGLKAVTASTIEFLRPIPSVALIPLAALLYGPSIRSALLLAVYAAFWQVLVQVIAGVADLDPVAEDTARSYRLGRLGRLRHVVWPTTLPYLMTGVRLAATVALILTITAELFVAVPGIGREILDQQQGGNVPEVYALVLLTGLLGVLVNAGARELERRALSWHPSVQAPG